jgi:hypothetical protein
MERPSPHVSQRAPELTPTDHNTKTNTTSSSHSELAIIQHEAWKDRFQLRDNSAPPESTPANPNRNTTIHSHTELALSEHDAWTDHVHFRDYAPAEPTRADPLGWVEKAEQARRTRYGLLTPPETPTRYEMEYSKGSSGEEEETETESEEADEDRWFNAYTAEQWALIKYGAARARFRDKAVVQGGDEQGIQEIGKMIMFYVFLAVFLHGCYTHRNESRKQGGGCQCHCCQSPGFGNATGT